MHQALTLELAELGDRRLQIAIVRAEIRVVKGVEIEIGGPQVLESRLQLVPQATWSKKYSRIKLKELSVAEQRRLVAAYGGELAEDDVSNEIIHRCGGVTLQLVLEAAHVGRMIELGGGLDFSKLQRHELGASFERTLSALPVSARRFLATSSLFNAAQVPVGIVRQVEELDEGDFCEVELAVLDRHLARRGDGTDVLRIHSLLADHLRGRCHEVVGVEGLVNVFLRLSFVAGEVWRTPNSESLSSFSSYFLSCSFWTSHGLELPPGNFLAIGRACVEARLFKEAVSWLLMAYETAADAPLFPSGLPYPKTFEIPPPDVQEVARTELRSRAAYELGYVYDLLGDREASRVWLVKSDRGMLREVNIAASLYESGQVHEAIPLLLRIAQQEDDREGYREGDSKFARCLAAFHVGHHCVITKEYERGLELLDAVVSALAAFGDKRSYELLCRALSAASICVRHVWDFSQADFYLKGALEVVAAGDFAGRGHGAAAAVIQVERGKLLRSNDQGTAAIASFEAALASATEGDFRGMVDHELASEINHEIGLTHLELERPQMALPFLRQAVVESRKGDAWGRVDQKGLSDSLNLLGLCYMALGDFESSGEPLQEAAGIVLRSLALSDSEP